MSWLQSLQVEPRFQTLQMTSTLYFQNSPLAPKIGSCEMALAVSEISNKSPQGGGGHLPLVQIGLMIVKTFCHMYESAADEERFWARF